MRLTSVAIRNHTRVADLYIEVRRHLVLVGTNDSGKTSILRCLDLLLGASQGALYTSITADDVRDRARPFVIEAQLECAANDPHFGRAVRQSGGVSTLTLRLEARVEVDGESLVIRRYAAGAWHETDLLQSQIDAIGWTYIADDQSFGRAHQSFIDGLLAAQDLQQERKTLAEVDRAYARVLEESQPLLELRRRIAAQLTAALPGDYQQNNLVFVPAARDSSSPLAGLRLQLRKNGEQRDLGDQSGVACGRCMRSRSSTTSTSARASSAWMSRKRICTPRASAISRVCSRAATARKSSPRIRRTSSASSNPTRSW